MRPIGWVRGGRTEPIDDAWGTVRATIALDPDVLAATATAGLASFSHLEVVYAFHRADPAKAEHGARRPRGNPAWPEVGILAQRGKDRPNHLGVSRCRLEAVDGLVLAVAGLDAIDGTPVIDVKPWMAEFGVHEEVRQPAWSHELMAGYWR